MLTSSDDERIRCGLWMPNCSGLQMAAAVFVECINQGLDGYSRRVLHIQSVGKMRLVLRDTTGDSARMNFEEIKSNISICIS